MAKMRSYRYDQEADVLYIDLGGDEPAYFEETSDGVFVGRGLFSGSPVEIRIVGWQKAGWRDLRARAGQASARNRLVRITRCKSWPKVSPHLNLATGSRTWLKRSEEVLVG